MRHGAATQLAAIPGTERYRWTTEFPLHYAAVHSSPDECADMLRGGKFDPASTDEHGRTALHLAALHGRGKAVSRIVEGKAPADARDGDGQGAVHLATHTSISAPNRLPFDALARVLRALVVGGGNIDLEDCPKG